MKITGTDRGVVALIEATSHSSAVRHWRRYNLWLGRPISRGRVGRIVAAWWSRSTSDPPIICTSDRPLLVACRPSERG